MFTRRRFVGYSALSSAMMAYPPLLRSGLSQELGQKPLRLAILGSTYHYGSALQTIADRFLVGYPAEGDWHMPNVQVVSVYIDQHVRRAEAEPLAFQLAMTKPSQMTAAPPNPPQHPPIAQSAQVPAGQGQQARQHAPEDLNDLSAARAKQFGFRLCRNIPEALRCGSDHLSVDAVLTILEQIDPFAYPSNDKGNLLLPNFDFFQQCAQVFEEEGNAVPYFNHKQLSFSFKEAQTMVQTAQRLKFPLLAGSAMPVTWRLPDTDIPLNAPVEEVVMVGVEGFGGSAFDALDAMQSMIERRKGGETGIKAVQVLEGDDVWAARAASSWSAELLSSALSRSDTPLGLTVLDGRTQDLAAPGVLEQLVKDPAAYVVEYTDGTRATLLLLNGAIRDFNIAARVSGHGIVSTQFFLSPAPNETYSACLAQKIEETFETRATPYPVERNLLTTGLLEACLDSKHRLNQRLETPQLAISYKPPTESQHART
jgi:hypothetical protein